MLRTNLNDNLNSIEIKHMSKKKTKFKYFYVMMYRSLKDIKLCLNDNKYHVLNIHKNKSCFSNFLINYFKLYFTKIF